MDFLKNNIIVGIFVSILLGTAVFRFSIEPYLPEQKPRFSSECISEGIMVVKSSKTEYFDVFYSEGCFK